LTGTLTSSVNSPRYQNFISPAYSTQFKDDAGNTLALTGVAPSNMSFVLERLSDGMRIVGKGIWHITDATNGKASYHYHADDVAYTGAFGVFVTVLFPGDDASRAFNPDFISIFPWEGGTAVLSTQDVNLIQVNGTAISPSNPVPTSSADAGSVSDAAWSGSGNGTQIAILKKIEALLAATLAVSGSVSVSNFPGTQPVSGTITANAGTNLNTSALALESGGHLATIDTSTAAAKTDLDTIVTNTNKIPSSPATEGGHLATIDTSTAAVATHLTDGTAKTKPQVGGSDVSTANPIPTTSGQVGPVAQWGSNPSTTNAGSETQIKFGSGGTSTVQRLIIDNESGADVRYKFDGTATANSLRLKDGIVLLIQQPCTVLHLYTAGVVNINLAGGVIIEAYN